jgi:hypothetical protein
VGAVLTALLLSAVIAASHQFAFALQDAMRRWT